MSENKGTVAVFSPGDMGHGVGQAVRSLGYEVVTSLEGRSAYSHELAERAGMRDAGSLEATVEECGIILSILPPKSSPELAANVAEILSTKGISRHFADLNAISPETSKQNAELIVQAGGLYSDGGIIGGAPGRSSALTRIYVSGPDARELERFHGAGMDIKYVGENIGHASAIKMCYAGLTKGTNSLITAVITTAMSLGVWDDLKAEFATSQPELLKRANAVIPRLPADAGRWIGEMDEIAATFAAADVTAGFHIGAGDIFALLAETPFAAETRETIDRERTLEQTLAEAVKNLPGPRN